MEYPGARLETALDLGDNQPSDLRAIVGGDFYDVFAIVAGRWGVVIGDVSGKGPDAASLTALVRYTQTARHATGEAGAMRRRRRTGTARAPRRRDIAVMAIGAKASQA